MRESLEAQTVSLAPSLQQQRLPPDSSSQCIDESRCRFGLPGKLPPNRGSRLIPLARILQNRVLT
eukprot:9439309-Pyramimonas_sp.AAC.1